MQIAFLFISSILKTQGDYRNFPQRFLNLMHFCIAVASYVALIAFSGVVTKSFCLNVSELIVQFTLGTYMFRGSEENKMKELSDSHPTRNRATPTPLLPKVARCILFSFYFIKFETSGRLWLLLGILLLLSASLYLSTYLICIICFRCTKRS